MNKYVSSIIKMVCALIILLNASIVSLRLVKTDENKTYSKTNFLSYVYDIAKNDEKEIPTIKEEVKPQEYQILDTFTGSITGYGPDCYGCNGLGNTSSGYNLITGGIYYPDKDFGQIRIVAADRGIPCGTVVRITGLKIYDTPFLAIVLDRGGAITGTKMDLAFSSESDPLVDQIGHSKNIQYEVLRYGGINKKC